MLGGICGGPQQPPRGWYRSIHFEFTSQINPKMSTSTRDAPEQAAAHDSAGPSGLLLLVVFCGASFGKFSRWTDKIMYLKYNYNNYILLYY